MTVIVIHFRRQNYLQKITSLNPTSVEEINHHTGTVGAMQKSVMQPHLICGRRNITSALQLLCIWVSVHTDVKTDDNAAFCISDRNALA